MSARKEESNSDTLDRSNISSIGSDNREKTSNNHHNSNKCSCYKHCTDKANIGSYSMINLDPTHFPTRCFCDQMQLNGSDYQTPVNNENNQVEWEPANFKWPRQNIGKKKNLKKLYDTSTKVARNFHPDKISENMDALNTCELKNVVETSLKKNIVQNIGPKKQVSEKIEIYYFDHGNSAYYHTTDNAPVLTTENFSEKTNSKITRFFAEIYGIFHLITTILTSAILQSLRFILFSLIRPLTVGVIQLLADYFIKPLLSITFNGLIQPFLILFYNMATSFRDCCEPLATTFGFYIREIAVLLRSFRLIEITHNYKNNSNT